MGLKKGYPTSSTAWSSISLLLDGYERARGIPDFQTPKSHNNIIIFYKKWYCISVKEKWYLSSSGIWSTKEHIYLFSHNAFHTDAPPGSCGSASSECICTTAARSIAALAKPTLSADVAGDQPSELLGIPRSTVWFTNKQDQNFTDWTTSTKNERCPENRCAKNEPSI